MLFVCAGYVKIEFQFGGTLFLNLPSWIGELILPVGFALILFRFFVRTIDNGFQVAREITK
jgi:TRAP-type C4-dicarboxylate transport system permease small subunit